MTRPEPPPSTFDPRLPAGTNGAPAYDPNAPAYNPNAPMPNGVPPSPGPSSGASPRQDNAYSYNLAIDSTQTVTTGTTSGMAAATAGATVNGTSAAGQSSRSSRRQSSARGPRRAKLQLRHVDPWSTLKLALILSVALFFVWMVAVGVLYGVLSTMDVFEKVNGLWSDLQGDNNAELVTPKLVFGGAALIGAINIVLFTALATVASFIYNLCSDLVGGLEITLAERR